MANRYQSDEVPGEFLRVGNDPPKSDCRNQEPPKNFQFRNTAN